MSGVGVGRPMARPFCGRGGGTIFFKKQKKGGNVFKVGRSRFVANIVKFLLQMLLKYLLKFTLKIYMHVQ